MSRFCLLIKDISEISVNTNVVATYAALTTAGRYTYIKTEPRAEVKHRIDLSRGIYITGSLQEA
jgi:hypothetical protein